MYDTFVEDYRLIDASLGNVATEFCLGPYISSSDVRKLVSMSGALPWSQYDLIVFDLEEWVEDQLSEVQKLEGGPTDDQLKFIDDCIKDSRKCGFPEGTDNVIVSVPGGTSTIDGDFLNYAYHGLLRERYVHELQVKIIRPWHDACNTACEKTDSHVSGLERRASTQACEEFVTCTETLWKANPDLGSSGGYTRDHYPFKCGQGDYSNNITKNKYHPWNVGFPDKWEHLDWPSTYSRNANAHGQPHYYGGPQNCEDGGDKIFDYFPDDYFLQGITRFGIDYKDLLGNDPSYPSGANAAGPYSDGPFKSNDLFLSFYDLDIPECGPFAWKYKEDVRCDTAMSLIFGDTASVGQICSVASAVSEEGADRMPGRCCLDTPKSVGNLATKVSATQ